MELQANLLLHIPDTKLAEGPVWDYRKGILHWVDIPQGRLHSYDLQKNENTWIEFPQMLGAAVLRERGGFMLALQDGFYSIEEGATKLIAIFNPELHEPLNRFNDGKCDPAGRFWAGSMRIEEPRLPVSALYCLNEKWEVEKKVDKVCLSNGLAWTRDNKTMYYIDTPTQRLDAFDFDFESGNIRNRRTVLTFAKNEYPDGMCIDEEDRVWIAFYGKGRVVCFDVDRKERLVEVVVPAKRTTSCCFGGKNLDTLFITSASGK